MKKGLVILLAASALIYGSAAFAAPRTLTNGELDKVAAGQATVDEIPNITVDQSGNIAAEDSLAGNGNSFETVDQSDAGYALSTGDNAVLTLNATKNEISGDTSEGSASVIGDSNTVTTSYEDLSDWQITGDGVIAKTATVTDSFNTQDIDVTVTVDITDSFNVTTNTLDVSGQASVSGIVTANSLGDQQIGANVNAITITSTSSVTTDPEDLSVAGALTETDLNQVVVNGSLGVVVGDITLGLPVIATPL